MSSLHIRTLLSGVLCLLAVVSESTALGQQYQLSHTFRRGNPEPRDLFGTAVVLEGGVAAIKSESGYRDGDGLSVTHIFEQNMQGGWDEAATLELDSGDNQGNFFIGQELAIEGGEIVISYGLEYNSLPYSSLQFATRDASGWSEVRNIPARFHPLDPNRFAQSTRWTAGRYVDISGNTAIADEVGALRNYGGTGVARLYEKGNDGLWRETANIWPDGYRNFNVSSVTIDGNTVAITDRDVGESTIRDRGGVFFFERQSSGEWVETDRFLRHLEDPSDQSWYWPVAEIDGDTAVTRETYTGNLEIFERNSEGWQLVRQISPTSSITTTNGGLAIEGNLIAQTVGGGDNDPLRVELYRRSISGEWSFLTSIADPEPSLNHQFGTSLAIDGGRVLVGATSFYAFEPDDPPGVAYLFVPVPEPNSLAIAGLILIAGLVGRMGAAVRFTRNT